MSSGSGLDHQHGTAAGPGGAAHDHGFLSTGNTKLSVKRKLSSYIQRNTGVLWILQPVRRAGRNPRIQALPPERPPGDHPVPADQRQGRWSRHDGDFWGKAAPGYYMAKLIIRFLNGIAETEC